VTRCVIFRKSGYRQNTYQTERIKMIEEGTHIQFIPGDPLPKTLTWYVKNKYADQWIGQIRWYPQWRKYSYFPTTNTVYEWICLREIADFCEKKTIEHNQSKKRGIKNGTNTATARAT